MKWKFISENGRKTFTDSLDELVKAIRYGKITKGIIEECRECEAGTMPATEEFKNIDRLMVSLSPLSHLISGIHFERFHNLAEKSYEGLHVVLSLPGYMPHPSGPAIGIDGVPVFQSQEKEAEYYLRKGRNPEDGRAQISKEDTFHTKHLSSSNHQADAYSDCVVIEIAHRVI